jgi:hypothetical protein
VAAWEEQAWAEGECERVRDRAELEERLAREARRSDPDLWREAAAGRPAGTELDSEIDRLAGLYPEPEVPGDEPGPDAARWIPGRDGAESAKREADRLVAQDGWPLRGVNREGLFRPEETADLDVTPDWVVPDDAACDNPAPPAESEAHVVADVKVRAAAARLQETGVAPDGLPRLLDPADAAPRAPEAWRRPDGTPHADPVLAARGWQAQGGIYRRVPQAETELEAG